MSNWKGQAKAIGVCWCGCGEEVGEGKFFVTSHDRKAETNVVKLEYGSISDFLLAHGYSPCGKSTLITEVTETQSET